MRKPAFSFLVFVGFMFTFEARGGCDDDIALFYLNRVAIDEAARSLWENTAVEKKDIQPGAHLKHWVSEEKDFELKVLRISPERFALGSPGSAPALGVDSALQEIIFQEPIYIAQILVKKNKIWRTVDGFSFEVKVPDKDFREQIFSVFLHDHSLSMRISDAKGPFLSWELKRIEGSNPKKEQVYSFLVPYSRGAALLPIPVRPQAASTIEVHNHTTTLWGDIKKLVNFILTPSYSSRLSD
jgi:hypothetical protein